VDSLLSIYASKARNKGIQLKYENLSDATIQAVPGEIRQVVANLISNSIDAIQGHGRIEIRVSGARNWRSRSLDGVRITVADTGAGIPAEERKRVFEPFFTTKREVGTGLGLWVCKSIVTNHQGSIRIRSATKPGRNGTAVSVFFPLNFSRESESEMENVA
jgi:signal transduction histidine kinase